VSRAWDEARFGGANQKGCEARKRKVNRKMVSEWENQGTFWSIRGENCEITLETRPSYCDRGNYQAKLHPTGQLAVDIDSADCWPRYYFDKGVAFSEVEAWLRKRGEWRPVEPSRR